MSCTTLRIRTVLVSLMLALVSSRAVAQITAPPRQQPSTEGEIRAALSGGVPSDRW